MASETEGRSFVSIGNEPQDFFSNLLVLLCYKRFGPQKGQHESCRAITRAMLIRSVAIECGLWRSGRTRAARLEVAGDRGERKFKIVDSGRGGKTVPLSHKEPVSGDTCGMVMKSTSAVPS
jgi:hypothetical protein